MALSVNCHEEEKFQSSSCPRKSSLVAGGPHVRSELSDPSSSHEGPLPRRRHMPPPQPPPPPRSPLLASGAGADSGVCG